VSELKGKRRVTDAQEKLQLLVVCMQQIRPNLLSPSCILFSFLIETGKGKESRKLNLSIKKKHSVFKVTWVKAATPSLYSNKNSFSYGRIKLNRQRR
jgi:hypothetical protein